MSSYVFNGGVIGEEPVDIVHGGPVVVGMPDVPASHSVAAVGHDGAVHDLVQGELPGTLGWVRPGLHLSISYFVVSTATKSCINAIKSTASWIIDRERSRSNFIEVIERQQNVYLCLTFMSKCINMSKKQIIIRNKLTLTCWSRFGREIPWGTRKGGSCSLPRDWTRSLLCPFFRWNGIKNEKIQTKGLAFLITKLWFKRWCQNEGLDDFSTV